MATRNQPSVQGDTGFSPVQPPAILADALALASQTEFDQLKGHFLASLNHEIRTPLSGVLGMTDLLLETRLDEEQREFVTTARECASQLLDTLNAILEYSAISAGNLDLHETEFHLRQLLESVAVEARPRAEAKGLRFSCECAREVPETVVGDARHLKQILTHLVRNAVKFTPRGQVEIRADYKHISAPGGRSPRFLLRVDIADTGIGIPPEKLRLIFESFRQLETGLARAYSGLGLGLAIADKLVRLMRGEISAVSRPGGGSVFTVAVPFGMPSAVLHEVPLPRQAHKHRILVVEDNKIAQQVVSHLLRRNNYEVNCAESGAAGIEAASRDQYDLILMDLQMPGMDGITATKHIRALPGYGETPILALTANYSDEYQNLCKQSGMQGALFKPIQKEEVLNTLKQYLT